MEPQLIELTKLRSVVIEFLTKYGMSSPFVEDMVIIKDKSVCINMDNVSNNNYSTAWGLFNLIFGERCPVGCLHHFDNVATIMSHNSSPFSIAKYIESKMNITINY